jgi:hypothetical protein
LSVKDAIKPGIFKIFYVPFTKEMIVDYFERIQVKADIHIMLNNHIVRKMTSEINHKNKPA